MTITKALKDRLVEKHGLKADATDSEIQMACLKAMGDGSMSAKEFQDLSADNPNVAPVAGRFEQMLEKAMDRLLEKKLGMGAEKLQSPNTTEVESDADKKNPSADEVFKGATGQGMDIKGDPTVKKATSRYTSTKSAMKWHQASRMSLLGNDVTLEERKQGNAAFIEEVADRTNIRTRRYLDEMSEAEYAKAGAVFKHLAFKHCGPELHRLLPFMKMTEHDQQLLLEAVHEDEWVGPITKGLFLPNGRKLTQFETKAVLEATSDASGGEYAVPQYFDYNAIRTPLLFGEILPYVSITSTDRGRAAHSYSIGTPTFVATGEGSAITPFSTTGFVATYDVPFFPASCGFEWGRDFEADSAPQFGRMVMAQIGDSFKNLIDYWIALGDGTTQPQGLGSASGGTTVSATGTSHATMVYNDAVNLQFGVTKPYRNAFGGGDAVRMLMNDSQYKRLMQIVTGVTGDTRPIFGMHVKNYQIGDYGVSIQNDIANGTMFFANFRGYRLYQRKGLEFSLITDGRTLTLAQTSLLFARARYGGKIELGGYYAKMTSAGIP